MTRINSWDNESLARLLAEGQVEIAGGTYNDDWNEAPTSPHQLERDLQQQVFDWAGSMIYTMPELRLLHAIPNGQYRPGQRPEPGLKAGVPDIHLPIASRGHHGLWIELKVGSNQPSERQTWWMQQLDWKGHATMVCRSLDEVQKVIRWYLGEESDD